MDGDPIKGIELRAIAICVNVCEADPIPVNPNFLPEP
jgi:hypothetical protein